MNATENLEAVGVEPSELLAQINSIQNETDRRDRASRAREALETEARRSRSHYSDWSPEQVEMALERLNEIAPSPTKRQPEKRAYKPAQVRPIAPQPDIEQENLDLFADRSRWPRKAYCSSDKTARNIRSLASAIKYPYIQANPPNLRVWTIYDVDRDGAGLAWEEAGLPPPSWATINKQNGHAHLVWGLTAPVLTASPDMRQRPLRYLCALESAFGALLGADYGFTGLITKNPSHPLWKTLRGPRLHYSLGELAEFVDLEKHSPKSKPERVGLGRNICIFDQVRFHAYRRHKSFKLEGGKFAEWQSHLNLRALTYNGDLPQPLDPREVWFIAKSVAKWTWNFDFRESNERFSKRQAARGRMGGVASGEARLAASEDKRSSAVLMASKGMSQGDIANELGVARETINRWLKTK